MVVVHHNYNLHTGSDDNNTKTTATKYYNHKAGDYINDYGASFHNHDNSSDHYYHSKGNLSGNEGAGRG